MRQLKVAYGESRQAKKWKNGTITLDVPADALTASVGEKNVLEVKVSQYDSVIDSNYITVLETE